MRPWISTLRCLWALLVLFRLWMKIKIWRIRRRGRNLPMTADEMQFAALERQIEALFAELGRKK